MKVRALLVVASVAGVVAVAAAAPARKKALPRPLPRCLHGFQDSTPVIATGDQPVGLLAEDLNGDGRTDLVVVGASFYGSASVHLGQPGGGFGTPSSNPVGNYPSGVVAGDFNGDGKRDLAVADQLVTAQKTHGTVSVLLGKGDGSFAARTSTAIGESPNALVAADLDGDGKEDLAIVAGKKEARAVGRVEVLLGRGDGTFTAREPNPARGAPVAIAAADLDGDGRMDLVTANIEAGTVSVLVGQGGGAFKRAAAQPVGDEPVALIVADLDGDGRSDLAVASRGTDSVSVLLNTPGGFDGEIRYPAGKGPLALAARDLDGDSDLDLAVTSTAGTVSVLLGKGDGTFAAEVLYLVGPEPTAILALDRALLIASAASDTVRILPGLGDGRFLAPATYSAGGFATALAVGDLDGDTKLDLAVLSERSGQVSVLLGNGDATFREAGGQRVGKAPVWIGIADLDGDGKPDLVTVDSGRRAVGEPAREDDLASALKSARTQALLGTLSILRGNGDGTFQKRHAYEAGLSVWGAAIGDFDADGDKDLAVLNGKGTVDVLVGKGDGSFAEKAVSTGARGRLAAAQGDVNRDGKPDLAIATYAAKEVNVLLGRGEGGFAPPVPFATDPLPRAAALADLDGDKLLDLAVAAHGDDSGAGRITVLTGDGKGAFARQGSFGAGEQPGSIAAGDLDADGRMDLAVGNAAGLSVLLGQAGGFGPRISYGAWTSPDLALGDFDGDGRLDVALTGEAGVTVLRGICR